MKKLKIERPAIATLGLLVLLTLTGCSDPNALGAIPSDAPIDIAEPAPTETPDDWFSAPVTEEPDWEGMSIGELKINGDEYSYLEVDGERRFRNVALVPVEVGAAEPRIDATKPFYVEFTSACRTVWTSAAERDRGEGSSVAPPEFSMFIARSETAVDGVPVSCTTDNMNYESEANSWAWFNDAAFSDGSYFIITTVKGSKWRQVAPLTISTGIVDKQGHGMEENGIWHDPRAKALPGDRGRITWLPLVHVAPVDVDGQWWEEPERGKFFTASNVEINGAGTNSDPTEVSFELVLEGEHRTARVNTWVLGRTNDSTSGPYLICGRDVTELGMRFDCAAEPFVDSQGKAESYFLILTSQPGNVRQVIKLPVK